MELTRRIHLDGRVLRLLPAREGDERGGAAIMT